MSAVALLDVNVLVALFDPEHVHHDLAHDWFADQKAHGWATCATTENGFLRVLTNPAYLSPFLRPPEVVDRLRAFRAGGGHEFWRETISITDKALFNPEFIRGHRQVTDIYLLGVARMAKGRLATFDRTIPIKAVKGATATTLSVLVA